MANVRVKMKPGALRKIRYLPATAAMLETYGKRTMDGANADLDAGPDEQQGFRMSSRPGARRPFGRWRVSVAAVTPHAKRHDRKHNTLLKNLGR